MKKLYVKLFVITMFVLLSSVRVYANQSASGWCELGNRTVSISSLVSTTKVQQSFPACTVTVYLHSTVTLATLYSDNAVPATPLANPFTANANGSWQWYAANGEYDVVLSGAGFPAPLTLYDLLLTGNITTINVLSYGAKCDGTTNDTTAITNANTALATNGGNLVIPGGKTCIINSIAFSAKVNLVPESNGVLSVTSANTATINGSIVAPAQQIFAGSGSVVFNWPSQNTTTGYPQWWGALANDSNDDGPPICKALNSGLRHVFFPPGEYGIGTGCALTTANVHWEGASRVYTDILPLNSTVSGPVNAMFYDTVGGLNAVVEHLRFTGNGTFTGYAFSAVPGVSGQVCMFSTLFKDNWISMGQELPGFFNGCLEDSFFTNNDIEATATVFNLSGVGINSDTFTDNHLYDDNGSFITSTANVSNNMQVTGLNVSDQINSYLFNITSGTGWQISKVYLDWEGAGGAVGGLATFTNVSTSTLTDFVATNGQQGGDMTGIIVNGSGPFKISNGIITAANGTGATPSTISLSGALDLDIDQVGFYSDTTAGQIGIQSSATGDVRISNSRFVHGTNYSIVDYVLNAENLTVRTSEFNNCNYNGTPVECIGAATSGRTQILDNIFIHDTAASKVDGFTSFSGSGTRALLAYNTYTGLSSVTIQHGSTQTFSSRGTIALGVSPTISSGFGGLSPSIAGNANGILVTVDATTGGTVGVVAFGFNYAHAPACIANDATTGNILRCNGAVGSLTVNGTMAAGDLINIIVIEQGMVPRSLMALLLWFVANWLMCRRYQVFRRK